MTPELRKACEIVFQEHRTTTQPVKWNVHTFHGRISLGLTELARDTLMKKNIIIQADKSKKNFTQLNPAVSGASSFEEAEEIAKDKKQAVITTTQPDQPVYVTRRVADLETAPLAYAGKAIQTTSEIQATLIEKKWYLKPLFYYIVWPLCAVMAGILISFLIDFAYTGLFLHFK